MVAAAGSTRHQYRKGWFVNTEQTGVMEGPSSHPFLVAAGLTAPF